MRNTDQYFMALKCYSCDKGVRVHELPLLECVNDRRVMGNISDVECVQTWLAS